MAPLVALFNASRYSVSVNIRLFKQNECLSACSPGPVAMYSTALSKMCCRLDPPGKYYFLIVIAAVICSPV
jgi:hypothetical protein